MSSIFTSITCLVFSWTIVISVRIWPPTIPTSCFLFRTVRFSESLSSSWFKIVSSRRWLVVSNFVNNGGRLSPWLELVCCVSISLSLSARRLCWFDLQFCISCDRISLSTSLNSQFFDSFRSSVAYGVPSQTHLVIVRLFVYST